MKLMAKYKNSGLSYELKKFSSKTLLCLGNLQTSSILRSAFEKVNF